MTKLTFNGNEYGWADVNVVLPGKSTPVEGITAIKYKAKREKKNIRGRGSLPVARGRGPKDYEGSITLLQSEVQAMINALPPGKDITDMAPFPITVTYVIDGGQVVTHKLLYCEFTEFEHGLKEGDFNMEVEIPIMIGSISFN